MPNPSVLCGRGLRHATVVHEQVRPLHPWRARRLLQRVLDELAQLGIRCDVRGHDFPRRHRGSIGFIMLQVDATGC